MRKNSVWLWVACMALCGCVTAGLARKSAATESLERLHASFVSADSMERAPRMDFSAWKRLRVNLRSQLQRLGDKAFAEALSREPDEVQVSVANCMGCDAAIYRDYPKTKYVLSAAPKI